MKLFKNNKALLVLFISTLLLLTSSSKVHGQFYDYINHTDGPPALEEEGTFIVMDDGSKVYGKKIRTITFGGVSMDKHRYHLNDVKAFQVDGYYYVRYSISYIKRIIHGRANIYSLPNNSYNSYYIQMGDEGEIIPLSSNNLEAFASFFKDCPNVYEKLNVTKKELHKTLRENHKYIYQLIQEYNTKCK